MGDPPNSEIANRISGGGFSAHFPRPKYQLNAVGDYLLNFAAEYLDYFKCVCPRGLTKPFLPCNLRSYEGRGVPDIALQSSQYRVFSENGRALASGTSCATSVRLATLPRPSVL